MLWFIALFVAKKQTKKQTQTPSLWQKFKFRFQPFGRLDELIKVLKINIEVRERSQIKYRRYNRVSMQGDEAVFSTQLFSREAGPAPPLLFPRISQIPPQVLWGFDKSCNRPTTQVYSIRCLHGQLKEQVHPAARAFPKKTEDNTNSSKERLTYLASTPKSTLYLVTDLDEMFPKAQLLWSTRAP